MEYFPQTNLTKPPGYVVRDCEISFNKDFTLNSGKESTLNDKIDCLLRHNKSAPRDSLTMRFVTAVTQTAVENVFGPNAFAQMWLEFVKKLRYHYENNMNLPGMDDVIQPNLSSCLLHQKLEMLQCCISAKKKRHELYDNTKEFGTDEFFDAQSDTEWSDSEEMIGSAATVSIASFSSSRDSSNMEPIGRLHPCGDMRLIRHNEFLMYVPITQANCLSERMQLPNNTWIQCWEKALPIPVVNQVRLFNETKIAEEILSMLENASIALMIELLRPVLFTAAAMYLIQQGDPINILLDTASLVQSVYRANRSGNRGVDDYLEALKQIRLTEKMILYHNSLKEQFNVKQIGNSPIDPPTEEELSLFIISLIQDFQVKREHYERNVISRGVPIFGASNGSLGHAVRKMMEIRDSYGEVKLPLPTRRQYVLRWMVPRRGAKSRPVPQRLFASIEDDEFRLCGSFSEDTIYV
uniref:Rab3 GTPase-activating protein catalytic subunit n=1 Tax=Heterorhabditis bacteriophora TaxID=37862 RepID=A0A1I7XMV4_HETBA